MQPNPQALEPDQADAAEFGRGLLDKQRAAFMGRGPANAEERVDRLHTLARAIGRYRDEIIEAVVADFGHRSMHETLLSEVVGALGEIRHTASQVKSWMKPRRVPRTLETLTARGRIHFQPKGVVGIMGAWNYPAFLCFSPMTGALAAGNHVLVKPSDVTPRTAEVVAHLVGEHFDPSCVAVVTGDRETSQAFSNLPFDHLLYTGGTEVGRHVMQAAAKNLVPVTLEMGGKSPTVIGPGANLARAIDSILMGKLINAGQTCIAPDYVLLPGSRVEEFRLLFEQAVRQRYPQMTGNPDVTWIVNDRHHARIQTLLEDARSKGAKVEPILADGEEIPTGVRVVPPTLVTGVRDDMRIAQEEIFGPILPLIPYENINQAIEHVNARPRPLALYLFESDRRLIERVVNETTSGGACVNDTMLHISHHHLPFGGIGPSGLGAYHGHRGFLEFSHQKGVLYQGAISPARWLRPPYGSRLSDILNRVVSRMS